MSRRQIIVCWEDKFKYLKYDTEKDNVLGPVSTSPSKFIIVSMEICTHSDFQNGYISIHSDRHHAMQI